MLPVIKNVFRTTREVEIRYTQDNKVVAKVGLASSEKWGDKENKFFVDATAFGKTGEALANVKKGHRIDVLGKIKTDQWQDKNDGSNRSKTVMIIERFEYIEKREDSGVPNQPAPQAPQPVQNNSGGYGNQQNQMPQNNVDPNGFDSDVPF